MKIYELQPYEYGQNANRSLKMVAKKKMFIAIFMNDNLCILQHVPQTMKSQNNKPFVIDSQ